MAIKDKLKEWEQKFGNVGAQVKSTFTDAKDEIGAKLEDFSKNFGENRYVQGAGSFLKATQGFLNPDSQLSPEEFQNNLLSEAERLRQAGPIGMFERVGVNQERSMYDKMREALNEPVQGDEAARERLKADLAKFDAIPDDLKDYYLLAKNKKMGETLMQNAPMLSSGAVVKKAGGELVQNYGDDVLKKAGQLFDDAAKQKPQFLTDMKDIASSLGLGYEKQFEKFALKTKDSIAQKLIRRGIDEPMTDTLRTTLVIKDPGQLDDVLGALEKKGYKVWNNDLTNRFLDATDGYKDISIKFSRGEGDPIIKELQLLQPNMLKAKFGIGHDVYDISKEIEILKKTHPEDTSLDMLKGKLDEISKRLYSSALAADKSLSSLPTATSAEKSSLVKSTFSFSQSEMNSLKGFLKTATQPASASAADSGEISSKLKGLLSSIQGKDSTALMESKPLDVVNKFNKEVFRGAEASQVPDLMKKLPPEAITQQSELPALLRTTNKVDRDNALTRIATEGVDAAENFVMGATKPTAEHTTTAYELIRKFQAEGNHERAVRVADALNDNMRKAGQSTQAAQIYDTLSPESILVRARRFVNESNERKWFWEKDFKLPENFSEQVKKLAEARDLAGDEAVKQNLAGEISGMLGSLQRKTIGSKIALAQTEMQLLNPKTITRNVVGNEMFYRVDRVSKYIATPIDWARSSLTGGERTITFHSANQGTFWKDFLAGAKAGWEGKNLPGMSTQFDLPEQTFSSKWNPFYWGEKALGASLRSFDYAAFNRAKNQTIGEMAYLKAANQGLRGNAKKEAAAIFAKNADENILKVAEEYGKYITFQDDTLLAKGFSGIKKGLNAGQDFGLGDLALKYPKTPANIIMRAVDYSPIGFLRSASLIAQPYLMKGGAPTTREATMALSRAITGTAGFTGMGYFLAEKGIITADKNKDKDVRALQKQVGVGQYKVNLSALKRWVLSGFSDEATALKEGDKLYSYDWAQPIAISLSIGANMEKAAGDASAKDTAISTAQTAIEGAQGGVNTLAEQPLVSGLTRLFGYGDVVGGVSAAAQSLPASFTPALGNQLNQFFDNTKRETYDPSYVTQGKNLVMARIPGLSNNLPARPEVLGGGPSEVYQGNSNNIFNVFFNPGFVSEYTVNEDSRLVMDIFHAAGKTEQFPRLVGKTIEVNGKPKELTQEEYVNLQGFVGQKTSEVFNTMANSPEFMSLTDDEKSKLMANALSDIGKEAKYRLFGVGELPTTNYQDDIQFVAVRSLVENGDMTGAKAMVESMTDEEYKRYEKVRASFRAKNTRTFKDLLDSDPKEAVRWARSLKDKAEAERIIKNLSDDEYVTYNNAKRELNQ